MATANFIDTITLSYVGDGKPVTSKLASMTGTAQTGYDQNVPAATTNLHVLMDFPFATVQACVLQSDQTVTLYTNAASTGAPDDTIVLSAGVPVLFYVGGPVNQVNPFTANVVSLYITNASGAAAHVQLRVLYNA